MSHLLQHMRGPKIEGKRKKILYPTHADYVDGLDEKIETLTGGMSSADDSSAGMVKLYSTLGNATYGTITQATITQKLNEKVGVEDTIQSTKIMMSDGSTLQESWNSGGGDGHRKKRDKCRKLYLELCACRCKSLRMGGQYDRRERI